jgi:hypothetical protein
VVDLTGRRQVRLKHFKVLIQVIFGDLAGRKAIKQSSRRSFRRGHVHVAHPYQRDLPLIPKLLVHRPLSLCSECPRGGVLALNLQFMCHVRIGGFGAGTAAPAWLLQNLDGGYASVASAAAPGVSGYATAGIAASKAATAARPFSTV